jgi:MIP family channel proteins
MHKHSRPRRLLAEFAGTFAVVLISVGAVAADAYLRGRAPGSALAPSTATQFAPLTAAIAYGVAYGAAVAALGRISGGHFNPAVSVAHWVTHRFGTFDTLLYVAAQLAGASAAAYALRLTVQAAGTSATVVGPPVLASGLTRGPALLIEGAMTFALVLALWAALVGRARPRYWLGGGVAGVVVAAASFAGAPYTGGAMNPARAFGLALPERLWGYQNVYWVGPLAGAVAAASLYDLLFRRSVRRAEAVPHS